MTRTSLGTLCGDLICICVTSLCTLCGDLICVCVTSLGTLCGDLRLCDEWGNFDFCFFVVCRRAICVSLRNGCQSVWEIYH